MAKKVLVVDDEKMIVKGLRFSLEQDGMDVDCAYDGEEALTAIKQNTYDVVLLDVMLPKISGFDVCQQVREFSDVPIIMLTAKGEDMDKILGLEYGADEYITKPFSSTYLKAKVDSLFKQRQMLYDYYTSKIKREKITNITDQIESATPQVTHFDDDFIRNILQSVEENIHNPDFKIDDLAEAMGMSRTVFYRKMKSLMGVSPVDFMKSMRIKRAVQLLEQDQYTVSEVGYMSGFATPQYFSKVFKETMNCTPKEYKLKKHPDELKL